MFDRILKRMQEHVRTRKYVMTLRAEDEMDSDGLTIYDVESVVLTGQITERQKDHASSEWKYVIGGRSLAGDAVVMVAKLSRADKLVFLTVFRA